MADEIVTTAIINIAPQHDLVVQALVEEAGKLRAYAVARTIATDADLSPATSDLAIIAKVEKTLVAKRSEYLKPIKAHVDTVNAVFSTILTPIKEADTLTRDKINAYRAVVEKRRLEAEAINRQKEEIARREAALNGTGEIVSTPPVDVPLPVKHVYTDLGNIATMKIRKYRVVDFALLPDEYKIENSALLNKVVKAGIPTIPGVEIYSEETIRVTAK